MYTGQKTIIPILHNSQNTKCREQSKDIKAVREKDQAKYKGRPIRKMPNSVLEP